MTRKDIADYIAILAILPGVVIALWNKPHLLVPVALLMGFLFLFYRWMEAREL